MSLNCVITCVLFIFYKNSYNILLVFFRFMATLFYHHTLYRFYLWISLFVYSEQIFVFPTFLHCLCFIQILIALKYDEW